METDRAIEIVKKLADGVDPYTGKVCTDDSPFQKADTVRALGIALECLEGRRRRTERKENGPSKFGKAWSEAEEKSMLDMFDAKVKVDEIARKLERTNSAIWARLEKVGRVSRDESGKIVVRPVAAVSDRNPEPASAVEF